MEYKYYYLIRFGENKKILVLARTSQEAVNFWIASKQKELEEEGRVHKFNPKYFTIEEIEREDLLIKASG